MSRIPLPRMLFFVAMTLSSAMATRAEASQADVDAYNAALEVYNARLDRYERAVTEFNNERNSYQHAVDYYNSLPPEQRTQFQRDRLERWYNYLQQRLTLLDAELQYLVRRGKELDAWRARLS